MATLPPAILSVFEADGHLQRLFVRGRWRTVRRVLAAWVVEGRWWGTPERREYVRLEVDGLLLEAYRTDDGWHLAAILD
ncbi:MAG: hypothetical protein R3181_00275 [Rubricoccaceae bacterium]|nr:hypothetical protein [Rubricoccaceae bacterium]